VSDRMPSLCQLLRAHAPLLLLDAASARIRAGLWRSEADVRWAASDEEAGVGLFRCLTELNADLPAVRAFAFADGPGSVLGIRTAAVAVRTWCALSPRPAFSYGSLALAAAGFPRPGGAFIADARRGAWHRFREGGPLERVPTAELAGPLITLAGFRHWTPLPPGVEVLPYDLAELLPRIREADLFRPAPEPDAFLHEEPSYVTWTPQIHRAP
jgi:tRNA threonylcarbamoyladenosine biosynthesis protein TsaB